MNADIKYNEKLRKRFLRENRATVKRWTEEVTGRAAIYGMSDELSVAIVAFNAAIDRYNGRGDFYDFARAMVRARLYELQVDKARRRSVPRKNFS